MATAGREQGVIVHKHFHKHPRWPCRSFSPLFFPFLTPPPTFFFFPSIFFQVHMHFCFVFISTYIERIGFEIRCLRHGLTQFSNGRFFTTAEWWLFAFNLILYDKPEMRGERMRMKLGGGEESEWEGEREKEARFDLWNRKGGGIKHRRKIFPTPSKEATSLSAHLSIISSATPESTGTIAFESMIASKLTITFFQMQ